MMLPRLCPPLLRPSLDFGLFPQCAQHRSPSGRFGKTVLPGPLARTLALPLPPCGALFAVPLLPDVIPLCKSGFLVTLTVYPRNKRSWTFCELTSPPSIHLVSLLMRHSFTLSRPELFRLSLRLLFLRSSMPPLHNLSCGTHRLSVWTLPSVWMDYHNLSSRPTFHGGRRPFFVSLTSPYLRGVVSSLWKHSIVVPVFKRGDLWA